MLVEVLAVSAVSGLPRCVSSPPRRPSLARATATERESMCIQLLENERKVGDLRPPVVDWSLPLQLRALYKGTNVEYTRIQRSRSRV